MVDAIVVAVFVARAVLQGACRIGMLSSSGALSWCPCCWLWQFLPNAVPLF